MAMTYAKFKRKLYRDGVNIVKDNIPFDDDEQKVLEDFLTDCRQIIMTSNKRHPSVNIGRENFHYVLQVLISAKVPIRFDEDTYHITLADSFFNLNRETGNEL